MAHSFVRHLAVLAAFWLALAATGSPAAVIIFTNRTRETVDFRLRVSHGAYASPEKRLTAPPRPYRDYQIASSDTISLPVLGPVELEFPTPDGQKKIYLLEPNTVCYFGSFESGLDLQQISFDERGDLSLLPAGLMPGGNAGGDEENNRAAAQAATAVIPVKVLVDDNEAARTELWQERLRNRLHKASQILERTCRVRFEIVAFDRWDTDDKTNEFEESLAEFEREVDPAPAKLAIGFASQFDQPAGPTKLGGVRGPFSSHCLIREWPKVVSENERLEVLLHELCHELGAAHSPEPDTVLRPMLGDGQARARAFRIKIDPVNALALYLTGEEVRVRNAFSLAELSTRTKLQLQRVYTGIDKALPEDPAAKQIRGYVEASLSRTATREQLALSTATRRVLDAIVAAARDDEYTPVAATRDSKTEADEGADEVHVDTTGSDKRTERLVRAAGQAALALQPRQRSPALLLALAIACDPKTTLAEHPQLRPLVEAAENKVQRDERIHTVGEMSMRGRADLAKHFFLSAALSVAIDPVHAEQLGLAKELADSQEGSGFSFVDYAADLAGMEFAQRYGQGKSAVERVLSRFSVSAVMPDVFTLEEDLSADDFETRYGDLEDRRFLAVRERILARISALPAYATPKPAAAPEAAQPAADAPPTP